jgi:VCBS repeat-containing protein
MSLPVPTLRLSQSGQSLVANWVAAFGDAAETDAVTTTNGNVLTNDPGGVSVSEVAGSAANVGVAVAGNNGGVFVIASTGAWTFDPDGDFAALTGSETADTSVTYHASDGQAEASATLTVTVSSGAAPKLWTPAEITTALWLDTSDDATITAAGGKASEFRDKSPRKLVYTQSVDAKRPTVGTNKFTLAGGQYMDCTSSIQPLASGPMYVFAVTNKGDDGCLFTERMSGGRVAAFQFYAHGNGSIIYSDGVNIQSNTYISAADAAEANGLAQLMYSFAQGVRTTVSINGHLKTSTQGTPYSLSGEAGSRLWARETAALAWAGDFHEKIILTAVAPSADLAKTIQGYFAHKWDALLEVTTLVDALPSDHPYKSSPPYVE